MRLQAKHQMKHFENGRATENKLGLTLVEMLMVIGIIGILAAIIFVSVPSMINRASSATSASNLRQIHSAIMLYTTDHGGHYPGPVWSAQFPVYSEGNRDGMFAYNLREYLPPSRAGTLPFNPVLSYPNYENEVPNFNAPSYFVNREPISGVLPFGAATNDPEQKVDTMRVIALPKEFDVSRTILMAEADKKNPMIPTAAGWFSRLPEEPAHGNQRNALFYDGSVESLPLESALWRRYP